MTNNPDILTLLERLVSIRSTADNPAALAEVTSFAANYLAIPELKVQRLTQNGKHSLLVSPAAAKNRKFDVVLNAHLDVVPAADRLFAFKVKGTKAYGRGVLDMKGAGAALMKLYRDLARAGQLPSVSLTLVTDEEIGGHDGVKMLLEKEKVEAAFFLAGEPTDLGICLEQKGVLWLELLEKGKPAHGSKPWEGQNAIVSLAKKLTAFYERHPQPKGKEDWKTSYTLSILQGGGEAKNVVADKALAYMDVRRVKAETTQEILSKLRKDFKDTQIKPFLDEPCLETDPSNKYVQLLSQSIARVAKKEAVLTRETFGSDGRFYSAAGVPAINFGPVGGDMHGDHEWVDLASLAQYYDMLKDFLLTV